MKKVFCLYILCQLLLLVVSCSNNDTVVIDTNTDIFTNLDYCVLSEEADPILVIHEGIISQKADTFRIIRDNKTFAVVLLSKPHIIAQANQNEEWGYFQFPKIFRAENGYLIAKWQMKDDSHTAFGLDKYERLTSKDEGTTWETIDFDYFEKEQYRVELRNGDILQVKEPTSKNINDFGSFPLPVNPEPIGGQKYNFYRESELPEELKGLYFEYYDKLSNKTTQIHASLNDPDYLRYVAQDNLMPVVWRGDIKELNDGSLIAGVYPCLYQNSEGKVLRSAVSFYKSTDKGNNWNIIGKIPYTDGKRDYSSFIFDDYNGFNEPTFEVLKDGTYICVMRNFHWSAPMCKTFSRDEGYTWSEPEPFTPNGVKPRLMLLGNNVLVLTSGRPGLQLRFSIDGDGKKWTEAIDMMPFIDEDGNYKSDRETCGYSDLIPFNDNTFYMVYSDFRIKNVIGEDRKSILFRKVEVIKK